MNYKDIANGPQNVSRIILGCMRMPALDVDQAAEMISCAAELGINFFDHATCYGIDVALYLNNTTTNRSTDRDNGILDYCRLNDITVQAWSPLQIGMFKGCFVDHPDYPELNEALGRIGETYGISKTAIARAWILRHPAKMQVIAGTMNTAHLKDICDASRVELTHHEWYELYLASGKFLP